MKILALSFGRKMRNCDILSKHALMEAQKAGAQIKFINAQDMEIGHCTGCGACSAARERGKPIKCIIKDDYLALENEIWEADGIILAAPVYSLAPVGQLKNFIDRFGAAHDRAALQAEQDKRRENPDAELLDPRFFTDKYVAYISVGGAETQNWVSLGLPNMHIFGMSTLMKPVGQYDAYNMGMTVHPFFDENLMEDIGKLGKHLAESIGKPYEEVEWLGEEGACPVCHNNLITVLGKGTTIECPICGIEGQISVVEDEIKVEFSDSQKKRARGATFEGLREHYLEIEKMKTVAIPKMIKNKEKLDRMSEPYRLLKSTY
ncbi:MAG TPA: flavodoxin family protein [Clostridiales bacterium]|nr:flavodoxin family protein [Clostridiales bacterium]